MYFCIPRICLFSLVLSYASISTVALSQDTLEDRLQTYLMDAEDFCDEYCVKITGQRAVLRDGEPIITVLRGFSAVSVKSGVEYYAWEDFTDTRNSPPRRSEVLRLKGSVFLKNYLAFGVPTDIARKLTQEDLERANQPLSPILGTSFCPHGYAVLAFSEATGNGTEISKTSDFVMKQLRYKREFTEKEGAVGIWDKHDSTGFMKYTFDPEKDYLPVRSEFVLLGKDRKPSSDFASLIKTTWQKNSSGQWLPSRCTTSGNRGPVKLEFVHEFEWMEQDRWKSLASEINWEEFRQKPGPAWFDQFEKVFDQKGSKNKN